MKFNEQQGVGEVYYFSRTVSEYKYILEDDGFEVNFKDAFSLPNNEFYSQASRFVERKFNRTFLRISADRATKFNCGEIAEFVDRVVEDLPDYEIVTNPLIPENQIFGSLFVDSMTNKKHINIFFKKK